MHLPQVKASVSIPYVLPYLYCKHTGAITEQREMVVHITKGEEKR
jgi:hypothetical protein